MPSGMDAAWHKVDFYAECFYAECHYAVCRRAECHDAKKVYSLYPCHKNKLECFGSGLRS
jgi:hypothetical protein